MSATQTPHESAADVEARLMRAFAQLKTGYERDRVPSLATRLDHLARLQAAVLDQRDALCAAVSEDFGNRSVHETLIAELFLVVESIRHTRSRLGRWMKPQRRSVTLAFKPARARVEHQPLGVVGVIAPWNYPLQLALLPLVGALAAGNRVLIKPSELTPATGDALKALLEGLFPTDLVQVVTGGVEVGAAFANLPFDHLFFTGSTRVGSLVMQAAARNLTPVTLELGGKSPAIVHESFPLATAAENIAMGKCFNAGQTCVAPDYVLARRDQVDALVGQLENQVARMYPRLATNPDYTSIVCERHRARLEGLVEDARSQGATVIEINPAGESFAGTGKIPPTVILDATDEMAVMQEEIFGPLLPIVGYDSLGDAIRFVNDRPRPLALYYFDHDRHRVEHVTANTVSGGVSVNSTMLHVAQENLPFGGVGPSGMGAYHGHDSFRTFSHEKAVFLQAKFNASSILAPPYGGTIEKVLKLLLRK